MQKSSLFIGFRAYTYSLCITGFAVFMHDELKEIVKLVNSYGKVNSIFMWLILLSLNYHRFYEIFDGNEYYKVETYKEADNYLLGDKSISIYERERKRQQIYSNSFELVMNDRYLYKVFNENSKNKIAYKRLF